MVRSNFTGTVTVSTDSQGRRTVREVGRRIIKEEVKKENAEEERHALPPFTSLMRRGPRTPPVRVGIRSWSDDFPIETEIDFAKEGVNDVIHGGGDIVSPL